jgi:FMN phosphatase YigB (HAD superfamily)
MSDMPAVLLDCDGVIVDNIAFEQQVTRIIIDSYAGIAGLTLEKAEKRWQNELVTTKGNVRWYDYAFHCDNLGLDGNALSRRAHFEAAHLLSLVEGFQDTHHLLREYGVEIGIVSDATNWVVNFKLDKLGLHAIPFVFGSNDATATKASATYWDKLTARFEYLAPSVLVDNRQINLIAAHSRLPGICLIQFEKDEHVMTLPSTIAPRSNSFGEHSVEVVHSHIELQQWIRQNLA